MPTPVHINVLRSNLQGYDPELSKFLLDGFTHGFDTGNTGEVTDTTPANSKTILKSVNFTKNKLQTEIHEGRIAGPFDKPPFTPFHISPLALRPKKNPGEFRLLHNLSYPYDNTSINSQIPDNKRHVQYATVGEAIQKMQKLPRGSFAAKTDIASAFRIIPIKPDHYPQLGIKFDGKFYYDKVLPQGLASSCKIFETFSTAIQWMLEQRVPGILCVHYIDDFLIIAETKEKCQQHLDALLDLLAELGVPVATGKTTEPATKVVFLGIELDTNKFFARLPEDKLLEYRSLLRYHTKQDKIKKRELDTLIGKLGFATNVVPARPFLRRLIDLASSTTIPYYYIRLTKSAKEDMKVWLEFLDQYNGITFFRHNKVVCSNEINMLSDASKLGFGASFGNKWIQAEWPSVWKKLHITILEMYPIYVLVTLYAPLITNSNILFHCDNEAVVTIINKQSSKDKKVMAILRPLVLTLMKFNIQLRTQHIPGISNILCDRISRFQVDPDLLQQYGMLPHPTPIPDQLLPKSFILT